MRENYTQCYYPSKFQGQLPITEYVYKKKYLHGDIGEDYVNLPSVSAVRYGRRILWIEERGFVYLTNYGDKVAAAWVLDAMRDDYPDEVNLPIPDIN